MAKTLTQALVDGGCAFLLKKKCKSHQILASSDSPKPNPFLEQIHCQPPSKWGGKNHCSYKLSCVVLSHPQTLPSHRRLPIFLTQLLFWLSASQVSPHPQLLYLPHTPLWPPFDPLLPHIYPPSPSLSPGQAHSSQSFVPSLPFPSPPSILHLCLPLPLCARGQQREREGVEEERRSDRS